MRTLEAMMILAAGFDEQVKRATQDRTLSARELLIGLTIALAVGIAIVLWLILRTRMKSNRQDQERLAQMARGQSSARRSERPSTSTETDDGRRRRRKRRKRRDHRPRNPPLSQTGGLPPVRPDDQLPKY